VTLPGAFVGAVFAGASPLQAAEFQMVVLAAILAAGALTVASFTWMFGAPVFLPLVESPLGRLSLERKDRVPALREDRGASLREERRREASG
jgi:hypothetical protein